MRENRRRKTDRDAVCAHHQEQRNLRGEIDRFFLSSVVVGDIGGGLPVEDFLLRELGQAALDITNRGVRHAGQERAEVSLSVDEVSLALAPQLVCEDYDCIADGSVAVRVVLHRLADDVGDLGVSAVVLLVEGVHDAALDRLKAVLDRRNRARADDVRRILAEVEVVKLLHRPEAGEPRLWPRRSRRRALLLLALALRWLRLSWREDVEIVEQARRKILLVVVFPLFHFGILYHTAVMRWLEEVEGGFALGAGEVGDEARERESI